MGEEGCRADEASVENGACGERGWTNLGSEGQDQEGRKGPAEVVDKRGKTRAGVAVWRLGPYGL